MDVPQEWLSREAMLAAEDADALNDETFGDLGDDDGGWDDPVSSAPTEHSLLIQSVGSLASQ
jgi:hypothetical protein